MFAMRMSRLCKVARVSYPRRSFGHETGNDEYDFGEEDLETAHKPSLGDLLPLKISNINLPKEDELSHEVNSLFYTKSLDEFFEVIERLNKPPPSFILMRIFSHLVLILEKAKKKEWIDLNFRHPKHMDYVNNLIFRLSGTEDDSELLYLVSLIAKLKGFSDEMSKPIKWEATSKNVYLKIEQRLKAGTYDMNSLIFLGERLSILLNTTLLTEVAATIKALLKNPGVIERIEDANIGKIFDLLSSNLVIDPILANDLFEILISYTLRALKLSVYQKLKILLGISENRLLMGVNKTKYMNLFFVQIITSNQIIKDMDLFVCFSVLTSARKMDTPEFRKFSYFVKAQFLGLLKEKKSLDYLFLWLPLVELLVFNELAFRSINDSFRIRVSDLDSALGLPIHSGQFTAIKKVLSRLNTRLLVIENAEINAKFSKLIFKLSTFMASEGNLQPVVQFLSPEQAMSVISALNLDSPNKILISTIFFIGKALGLNVNDLIYKINGNRHILFTEMKWRQARIFRLDPGTLRQLGPNFWRILQVHNFFAFLHTMRGDQKFVKQKCEFFDKIRSIPSEDLNINLNRFNLYSDAIPDFYELLFGGVGAKPEKIVAIPLVVFTAKFNFVLQVENHLDEVVGGIYETFKKNFVWNPTNINNKLIMHTVFTFICDFVIPNHARLLHRPILKDLIQFCMEKGVKFSQRLVADLAEKLILIPSDLIDQDHLDRYPRETRLLLKVLYPQIGIEMDMIHIGVKEAYPEETNTLMLEPLLVSSLSSTLMVVETLKGLDSNLSRNKEESFNVFKLLLLLDSRDPEDGLRVTPAALDLFDFGPLLREHHLELTYFLNNCIENSRLPERTLRFLEDLNGCISTVTV
jgi:hypothetical protein